MSGLRPIMSLALILILTVGCTTTASNRSQINFVPDGTMNRMGSQAYDDILKKERRSPNRALTERVETIGRRIAAASGAGFQWQFALIDKPDMVNAFCLPGGKIAVYTGILKVAANDAGLAAVLGHEVAHATLRHSAERLSHQLIMQAGSAVALETFGDNKYKGAIAAAMGIGLQFGVALPFSRAHETEADKIGLRYMARAGYDPREAAALWKRMAAAGGGRSPEILSTHPDPLRRAAALEKEAAGLMGVWQASPRYPSTALPVP